MSIQIGLLLLGLLVSFCGSVIITLDLFKSKKHAIEIGLSRWSGDTDEEKLRLPPVQQLLEQSRHAKCGFVLITIGFFLQIIGTLPIK